MRVETGSGKRGIWVKGQRKVVTLCASLSLSLSSSSLCAVSLVCLGNVRLMNRCIWIHSVCSTAIHLLMLFVLFSFKYRLILWIVFDVYHNIRSLISHSHSFVPSTCHRHSNFVIIFTQFHLYIFSFHVQLIDRFYAPPPPTRPITFSNREESPEMITW